ncbi:MAG TPA: isoprenylcysteine carboxylmethyltransferase family protein [Candidatus Baltobacteraceae bacterium]
MSSLLRKAALGTVSVVTLMGAVVFLSAWTFDYWQAWVFLAVYADCTVLIGVYLWKNDRALLERRMNAGPAAESAASQKIIMVLASAAFIALLAVPGLDHRLHWSKEAPVVAVLGDILLVVGFLATLLVLRENSFAAGTIQVAQDQTVISTGPYAIVRHPLYAGATLLLVGIPLALGSYWGLTVLVCMMPVIIWRLLDEEAFLAEDLPGYRDYQAKVRWRLMPGLF